VRQNASRLTWKTPGGRRRESETQGRYSMRCPQETAAAVRLPRTARSAKGSDQRADQSPRRSGRRGRVPIERPGFAAIDLHDGPAIDYIGTV
jgi:hypothetical protein